METNAEPRAAARLLAGVVAAIASLTLVVQVAVAGPPAPSVPDKIKVGEGNKVFLIGHAAGVQIYSCNGAVWSSAVPRAKLYDDSGKVIVAHFAGPTWEARDGSTALGALVDKVIVDEKAIPWLLLSAKTTPGLDGNRLGATSYIQRIETSGGLMPPAADCNALTAGTVVEVPYTAEYVFWKHTASS